MKCNQVLPNSSPQNSLYAYTPGKMNYKQLIITHSVRLLNNVRVSEI